MRVEYSSVERFCSSEVLLHTWDVDTSTRSLVYSLISKCWNASKNIHFTQSHTKRGDGIPICVKKLLLLVYETC